MRNIWVTFTKEGIHKYPGADTDPKLATGKWDDVSFLGYPHRHTFHFKVWIEVFHNDRDIEFIQFKRWLERLFGGHGSQNDNDSISSVLQLDFKSCEMIADDLAKQIQWKYPNRDLKISVAEDNENGCEIDYSYGDVSVQDRCDSSGDDSWRKGGNPYKDDSQRPYVVGSAINNENS